MSFMTDALRIIQEKFPQLEIKENEMMREHTSFRIGGPASAMAFVRTQKELIALLQEIKENQIPYAILGAGTNVLADDAGIDRLVICTKDTLVGLQQLGQTRIEAMAGQTLARTAVFARDLGLSGLEFAHGIPGTVGGGVYMNAGAYGGEICQVAVETTVWMPDGSIRTFYGEEQGFSYRSSVFENSGAVIIKTVFQLKKDDPANIQARMQQMMEKRRASQPLELPSAGSTFKRPKSGYAAALIDQAGLKGCGVGNACVSEKHAGFIVNLGGATAQDVKKTIAMVQEKVMENSGIYLEPEVRIW